MKSIILTTTETKTLTHLSLFTGIGGIDIAAEWAGFTTVGQCEFADYPTRVLEQRFPNVPRWRDIRTLTGESFNEKTGLRTVDVISGGFPCQPFSCAGKRKGTGDDRFLWPEMLRVIHELRPNWVVGENVAGFVNMALDTALSDLENEGYVCRTFILPACGVGAFHQRYRVFIVAHREVKRERRLPVQPWEPQQADADTFWGGKDVADAASFQREGSGTIAKKARNAEFANDRDVCDALRGGCAGDNWWRERSEPSDGCGRAAEPGLGGVADGLPGWVDGYWEVEPDIPRIATGVKDRVNRLKGLGNAVVPYQVYPVMQAIFDIEMQEKA